MQRKILRLLKFWRRETPQQEQAPPPPPSQTPPTSSFSFLVPDLQDIRPFLTKDHPVSLRELLQAISSPQPPQPQQPQPPSDQPINVLINNTKSKRKLDPTQSIHPFKRPKLLHTATQSDSNLIHRLPPHVWHLIFSYNQLDTIQPLIPHLPSTHLDAPPPVRTSQALSKQLKLALDAQQHRHDMTLISKSLSPIAKKAAWSVLLVGTLKMFDRVAQKFEADAELTSHLRTCILVYLPSTTLNQSPNARPSSNPSRPVVLNARSPRPITRVPQPRNLSHRHSQLNIQPTPHAKHRSSVVNTPNQPRSLPIQVSSSSAKNAEKFHSVLIPPPPNSKEFETHRNTQLNSSRRNISPLKTRRSAYEPSAEEDDDQHYDEEKYFEEMILASSLPSLFLSIARSIQVCCVIGDERLATRALKSLSVLSSLLTSLEHLFIEGGGQFHDLFTLVEGLRSITIRGQPSSLRVLSITGPNSTLTIPSHQGPPTSIHRRPSSVFPETRSLLNSSTNSSPTSHLSIQHLILGSGIPLTVEQLYWLITSVTSHDPGLSSLRVSLKAAESSLSSSTSSSSSTGSSSRHLLTRIFHSIGPNLTRLAIFDNWNNPLSSDPTSSSSNRRVTFEGAATTTDALAPLSLLHEPLKMCTQLSVLCLSNTGPLCSSSLLNVLPKTLKLLEIHLSLSPLDIASSYTLSPHDFVLACSASSSFLNLVGLQKIRIVAPSHSAFLPWKRVLPNSLHLSDVIFDFSLSDTFCF